MIRANYPIEISSYTPGGYDPVYGDPLPESWSEYAPAKVYGVNFPKSSELIEGGHDRVGIDKVLLIPPGFGIHARDRVRLGGSEGEEYEVIGEPETAEGNPFGWKPGGRVKLQRWTG